MRPIIASDLMNPEVLSVRPEMGTDSLEAYLLENQMSGAPVIDRAGTPLGTVSLLDLVGARHAGLGGANKVREVMTPTVFAVRDDATVPEIARTLLHNHLHRVLITRAGAVVGIVSTSDLVGLLVDAD